MASVSVFGLGYVGCVSAGCFADAGHDVIGVDVNPTKVDLINSGQGTIVEDGVQDLIASAASANRLRATSDVGEAVAHSEISVICVGTPSRRNGSLDLQYIERVSQQIGEVLRDKADRHLVVIRSTVLPGTIHELVIPTLERASRKRHGEGFAVCSNPEFLREGTSIKDFYAPPFTLVGADDPEVAQRVAALYAQVDAPVEIVATRVSEMIKYACNAFHAVKIGFANEIGNLCQVSGVDGHEVMRVFCQDTKLNISTAYLRPGFAFGGSCLPKDLRAAIHHGRQADVAVPILSATLDSNQRQIERAFQMVVDAGHRQVGVLGLAFKAGTDDLRESPIVTLLEMLIGKGYDLAIYDREVRESQVIGANREFIEREIPHIWTLMRPSIDSVLEHGNTIVVGNGTAEFRAAAAGFGPQHSVVDLVRLFEEPVPAGPGSYAGICW